MWYWKELLELRMTGTDTIMRRCATQCLQLTRIRHLPQFQFNV